MAWTTPATFTTGEAVTAAKMNAQVRDNLGFLYGAKVASVGAISSSSPRWPVRMPITRWNRLLARKCASSSVGAATSGTPMMV